jgi:hypothetical protein
VYKNLEKEKLENYAYVDEQQLRACLLENHAKFKISSRSKVRKSDVYHMCAEGYHVVTPSIPSKVQMSCFYF